MKRLLLRMSALGTIIALGLIAIAQAQRSSDPITSPVPAASVASQLPDANPLRSPALQQTTGHRNAGSASTQPGAPSIESMPTSPTRSFPLAAATDTGMTPPPVNPAPAGTPPQQHGFQSPLPTTQPLQPNTALPQMVGTAPEGSAIPAMPNFGAPVEEPNAAAIASPALVGTGAAPSLPTSGSYQAGNPTLPPLDRSPIAAQQLPVDAPHQLSATEARPMSPTLGTRTFVGAPTQSVTPGTQATGAGRPGLKELEGLQSPQLVVEKIAPAEIQVGRSAIFEIHVRNVGAVAASNVEIRDEIPERTRLQSTKPQASRGAQGELVWKLGTLNPGQDVAIEMELMPEDEGEIGSVATVHFQAEASVRTRATRPLLVIETETKDEILKGEELALKITVSNPGSGIAENVVLEEHVPKGFRHPAGAELEYEVGNLAPNESRELTLILEAVHPGPVINMITARGEPSLNAENQTPVEVIAPQLEVAVQGPKQRFLECEAVYNLSVRNPGTAPAKKVELAVEVPAGMKFVSGTNRAYYEEATRTVHWMLEEIPVKDGPPPVQLTLMPMEAGNHTIRLVSFDDSGAKDEVEQPVKVEGIVAIYFEVADMQDPIEVGGQTLYEIRVVNQGSKEATNVQLAAELPTGLKAVAAEGPSPQAQAPRPNVILFEPLQRLAAKADVTYRIRVEGVQPGDLRMQVQVWTDEIQKPIKKEESTRVYLAQ